MWFGRRNGSRRRLNVEEPPFSQTHSTEGLLCLKCPSLGASARRQGTQSAPTATRLEAARAYTISKLGWIREQRQRLAKQARETPRQFIERESHYLWGGRYLLTVVHREAKPSVSLDHKRITLTVRPGSDAAKRAEAMHAWHKMLLHHAVPLLIEKWEQKLQVAVRGYFLQRMKTKWGSCNRQAGHIRLKQSS